MNSMNIRKWVVSVVAAALMVGARGNCAGQQEEVNEDNGGGTGTSRWGIVRDNEDSF